MDFNNMDFNQMLSQAKKLKEELDNKKNDFSKKEFTGNSGGGMVSVTLNGKGTFTEINIDPQLVEKKEELHTLQDLVLAAINSANNDFKKESQNLFPNLADMPGAADFFKGDSNI